MKCICKWERMQWSHTSQCGIDSEKGREAGHFLDPRSSIFIIANYSEKGLVYVVKNSYSYFF